MTRRPDILADLSPKQRLTREQEDGRFLAEHPELTRRASNELLKRDNNTWAGIDVFARDKIAPYTPGDDVHVIVAARLDLDHPIYFRDNKFTECADCWCGLQYRPDVPQPPGAEFLCVCCTARRMREQAKP